MNLLAGLALGSLVGLLVGLSSAPVVGSAVAALLALLVAFFGLGGSIGLASVAISTARILGFCVGMSAMVLLGVYARAYGWLEPDIGGRVLVYEKAGFEPLLARELAAYEHLGLLVGTLSGTAQPQSPAARAGLLFGNDGDLGCATLARDRFNAPDDRVRAMSTQGAPWDVVTQIAEARPSLDADRLAVTVWQLLCEE